MPKALDGRSSAPRARRPYVPPLSGPSIRVVPAVVVLAIAVLARPALAAPATAAGVIVHYKAGTDAAERIDTRQDGDVSFGRQMLLPRTEVVQPDPGVSTAAAVKALEADPDVAFAEPNGVRHALATPNDELFNNEWGLENTGQVFSEPTSQTALNDADVDASAAWDQATGSSSVMVAVVDTGIDATHPDLAPNIWTTPGEIGGNARDDDGNGLVDDVHGWDFACRDEALTGANLCTGRSSAGDNSPVDANGHGTHVAGTVGARGNDGFGVAGVNWTAGLMSVRVLGADGSGTDADVVDGEAYAGKMGARVVNLPLGANTPLDAERLAMQNAPNTLFVV